MSRLSAIHAKLRKNRKKGYDHKVLFLDFDGVVNVPYEYGSPEYEAVLESGSYDFFRPEIVDRLNRLCHEYELFVVMTTSWRYSGLDYCVESLLNAGFDPDIPIEGMTDTDDPLFRREGEIFSYVLQSEKITGFVILDDIPMDNLQDYAVTTIFEVGYDEACDQRARELLDAQKKGMDTAGKEWNDFLENCLDFFRGRE